MKRRQVWLAAVCRLRGAAGISVRRRAAAHDQGRHPALALRHDGHQRNDAEGHRADDDRRAEQEGRPARQEARGGGRRSGVELAAVRREGAQLLEKDKVAVVFGCWTSVSRKSVLPVFEKDNGLLFYPVQYEGEESSKNVIYTGAAPNQQAIPAVDYLMKDVGGEALGARRHRLRLSAHDQQDPRGLPAGEGRRSRPTSRSTTRRSATPTGRRASRRSRSSARPARRPRSSRPSTATPTCRSTRSSATRRSRPRTFRSSPSRSAKRSCRASTPSRSSATWRRGTTSRASARRPTRRSSTSGRPTSRTRSAPPTIRWKRTTSASTCG